MSFMFKPLAYDDQTAINILKIDDNYSNDITVGNDKIIKLIADKAIGRLKEKGKAIVLVDGYASADFNLLANLLNQQLSKIKHQIILTADLYKSPAEIEAMPQLSESLPPSSKADPVMLFGRLFSGKFELFFDQAKFQTLLAQMNCVHDEILLILGHGSTIEELRQSADEIIYMDVTPKTAAIRAREGKFANIGDRIARPFNELMRRNYYVDFELIVEHRKELLQKDLIDLYIIADHNERLTALGKRAFNGMLKALSQYPFRCKPVYIEGIWGGEYIRKIRQINCPAKNIAWIFEMIPMEVSVVVRYQQFDLEFPFSTFFMKFPQEIMGKQCTETFDSYFPIRCNYDDSWHSNGNMSIQVHPDKNFLTQNYREKGSQDEAYYIISTGHGAKTYCGFNENADTEEFFRLTAASEETGIDVDYRKYINHIESTPGRQFMLPAGTIHSSGQNQFILELGSLTIGSYTYKIYDYNRVDSDGKRRPIHTENAKKVCDTTRRTQWVNDNIAIQPTVIRQTAEWTELLLGKTDLMYYETRRIEMVTGGKGEFRNNGQFTILTLVDGEHAKIYDKYHPEHCYQQNYLDIIIVPADIDEYIIENTGYQPIVVHKVLMKNDK